MPNFSHLCHACKEEFDDLYSSHAPVPTLCPLCGVDGQVQRVIPSVVHGRVPLTGSDLKRQVMKESKEIKSKVAKDENLRANIMGESKYEEVLTAQKKLNDTYKT